MSAGISGVFQSYAAKTQAVSSQDREQAEQDEFDRIFTSRHLSRKKSEPTLGVIPRFYFKKPREDGALQKLRKTARNTFLNRKEQMILSDEVLEKLYYLLNEYYSSQGEDGEGEGEPRINYDGFTMVAQAMTDVAQPFFKPSIFMKFDVDECGCISAASFFQYVVRKVSLWRARINISKHDTSGDGTLTESDLENYIFDLIQHGALPALANLDETFYPFYVCTAVRKFFFFLDPSKKKFIFIKDMIMSPILAELFDLQRVGQDAMTDKEEEANWFSLTSALNVYREYLRLDNDHDGMLNKEELIHYKTGTLTEAFVDRVFEECQTYKGEMDYKSYLDFVLAMENKKAPESLKYFFRLLDVKKKGFLTIWDINYFFREILHKLTEAGHELVSVEDVKDEIFDMVKPADPIKITYDDLKACGVGDTIVSMLTDMNGFWAYDNREMLVNSEEDQNDVPDTSGDSGLERVSSESPF